MAPIRMNWKERGVAAVVKKGGGGGGGGGEKKASVGFHDEGKGFPTRKRKKAPRTVGGENLPPFWKVSSG